MRREAVEGDDELARRRGARRRVGVGVVAHLLSRDLARRSEVYANDAALLAHMLAAETKEKFNAVGEAVGFPIKYFDTTRVGYTRL